MSAVFEQVMAQCARGCFTGLLRVRAREGNGEITFLSGIQDGIRFDSMEGDAALERLQNATDPQFEAVSSLPPIEASSSEPLAPEGGLHVFHAAQLMRYCETNSLTCALEIEVGDKLLTARYRLGELLSVEPDSEHTSKLAEAKQGVYRFRLPRFELPAGVARSQPAPEVAAPKPPAAPLAPAPRVPAAAAKAPAAAAARIAPSAILTPKGGAVAPRAGSSAGISAVGARPAAPAAAFQASANGPGAATLERAPAARPGHLAARGAEPVSAGAAARAAGAAVASPSRSAPVAPSPTPPARTPSAPAAPAPAPSAPAAPARAPSAPAAPLKGLWADAVSPPAQAAPLELARPAADAFRPAAPGAERPRGPSSAASNGSAVSRSPAPTPAAAFAPDPRRDPGALTSSGRKRSKATFVWLSVAIAVAVGAWLALGPTLP